MDGGALLTAAFSVPAFVAESHGIALDHGWWDDAPTWRDDPNLRRQIVGNKLMLIVSEVAEAADALGTRDMAGFAEELADILIRGGDLAGFLGIAIRPDVLDAGRGMPADGALEASPGLLLGIVTCLGTACEALRHDDAPGFESAVSDAMAATAVVAHVWTIDLAAEIRRKTEINRGRPYKHGKQF